MQFEYKHLLDTFPRGWTYSVCVCMWHHSIIKSNLIFFFYITSLELFMNGAALTVLEPLCCLKEQVQHERQLSDFSHAAAQNFPHLKGILGRRESLPLAIWSWVPFAMSVSQLGMQGLAFWNASIPFKCSL